MPDRFALLVAAADAVGRLLLREGRRHACVGAGAARSAQHGCSRAARTRRAVLCMIVWRLFLDVHECCLELQCCAGRMNWYLVRVAVITATRMPLIKVVLSETSRTKRRYSPQHGQAAAFGGCPVTGRRTAPGPPLRDRIVVPVEMLDCPMIVRARTARATLKPTRGAPYTAVRVQNYLRFSTSSPR